MYGCFEYIIFECWVCMFIVIVFESFEVRELKEVIWLYGDGNLGVIWLKIMKFVLSLMLVLEMVWVWFLM